jgi:hypothetical protein
MHSGPFYLGESKQRRDKQQVKSSMPPWLCATEPKKKGTAFIFLIGCFVEFCGNKRGRENGGEWRIFISYA